MCLDLLDATNEKDYPMLVKLKIGVLNLTILLVAVGCSLRPTITPPIPTAVVQQKTINDGVFTQAQVVSGQRVYEASCKTCHDIRFYRDTLRSWQDTPLLDFWYSIIGAMPADNPGSLMDSEYTEVVAYILSEIGFPSGSTALDPNNGMAQINIVSKGSE